MIRSAAVLLPLISAAAFVAACAQQATGAPAAAQSSGRECFNARNISSFKPIDDETVDLQVGARRYFRVQLHGVCPNIEWTRGVAVRTTSGSAWICQGMDGELVVPNTGIGPQRCLFSSVRQLSDEEARALNYYK